MHMYIHICHTIRERSIYIIYIYCNAFAIKQAQLHQGSIKQYIFNMTSCLILRMYIIITRHSMRILNKILQ